MHSVIKIVSGGQTGADRGGLEAARDLGLQRGGWAPRGWISEDGTIPLWYREGMRESSGSYRLRTEQNAVDSDGTLILSFGDLALDSGSYLTTKLCRKHGRPHRHFRISQVHGFLLSAMCLSWIWEHHVTVLNVAGPRESRERGIQAATRQFLVEVLRRTGEDAPCAP
jgi:hypothetical protein